MTIKRIIILHFADSIISLCFSYELLKILSRIVKAMSLVEIFSASLSLATKFLTESCKKKDIHSRTVKLRPRVISSSTVVFLEILSLIFLIFGRF